MAAKHLILKENKKIIEAGDKGKAFNNIEEARIYLKNLLLNYDYYLENKQDKTYFIILAFSLMGLAIALFSFIYSYTEYPGVFLNIATYIGIASIGITGVIDGFLAKFGLKSDKKELDTYIEKLKMQCGYTKSQKEELELMQEIVDGKGQKSSLIDTFISDITRDMLEVAQIKYLGFEEDILALNSLAKEYLAAKEQLKETHEYYVLSGSKEWFSRLLEIETRIKEKKKVHEDQLANKEELARTMQIIEAEGAILGEDIMKLTREK